MISDSEDKDTKLEAECDSHCSDIMNGVKTMAGLVESLGPLMTSDDESDRCESTQKLAKVVEKLPDDILSSQEIDLIADYFIARINDHFMLLSPALHGITALLKTKNCGNDVAVKALTSINDRVTCQALAQSQRREVYLLFESVVNYRIADMLKINGFIKWFILAMDGESDPRNLILVFSIIPKFVPLVKMSSPVAEELFAVLECYFPVDFTANSKFAISRDDLQTGLENCLVSSEMLVPFCMTMVMEKLESKLKVAILDSLQLVNRIINTWGGQVLENKLDELWNNVNDSLIHSSDKEVASACIKTITGCLVSLHSSNPKLGNQALESILAYCKVLLRDPAEAPFIRICEFFGAVAMSSEIHVDFCIKNILPHLILLLEHQRMLRLQILDSLYPFLTAAAKFSLSSVDKEDSILKKLIAALIDVLGKIEDNGNKRVPVTDSRVSSAALKCLAVIISFLDSDSRSAVYVYFRKTTSSQPITNEEALLLTELCRKFPEEVQSEILDKLKFDDNSDVPRFIDLIFCCTRVPVLTLSCTTSLIQQIEANKRLPVILSKLSFFSDSCDASVLVMMQNECQIIEKLLNSLCAPLKLMDEIILNNAAICLKNFMKVLEVRCQEKCVKKCLEMYFKDLDDKRIEPYKLTLLEGLLGAVQSDALLGIENLTEIVKSVVSFTLCGGIAFDSTASCRLVASLVNKLPEEDLLDSVLTIISSGVNNCLSMCPTEDCSPKAVHLLSWAAKALVLRTHNTYHVYLKQLLGLLTNQLVKFQAAEGFKIILTDQPDFLIQSCHCKVGILYKQRVFEYIKELIEILNNDLVPNKDAVYLCLAYFIRYCPLQLVINRLKELMKYLAICLERGEPAEVVVSSLDIVSSLVSSQGKNSPLLIYYIDTFIPRCLDLAVSSPSMNVRIGALDCLCLYSSVEETVILPYKPKVIQGLVSCLDDKKRLVRKKAVAARTRWFLVGAT